MSAQQTPLRAQLREPVDARRVAAVWQRVEARRRAPARGLRAPLLAFAACAAALGLTLWLRAWPGDASIAGEAPGRVPAGQAALRLASGAALAAVETQAGDAGRVVQLSDGTRVGLAPGSRLVPQAATSALTRFALERGSARFQVAPQGARRFEVRAGSLRVTVVGTVFSVSASALETRVAVEHGRVRVQSPAGERVLGAGESSRWAEQAAVSVPAAVPVIAPVAVEAPRETPHLQDAPRAAAALAAQSVEQLFQLSDDARTAGRPAEAARALERLLQLHARDPRASLAALTLARVRLDALGQPQAAVRALHRALALRLPQALQEDALATLVRAHVAAGDRRSAVLAAQRYLASYPQGRFAAEVERWAAAH